MNNLDQILCPVDFSEPSLLAASYATRLAGQLSLPLVFAYVVTPLIVFPAPPDPVIPVSTMQDYERLTEDWARNQLQRLEQEARRSVGQVSSEVVHGPAGAHIVDLAARNRGCLVVMGTHGVRGFRRFFLGSTTAEVLRRAPCPVLTVREWPPEESIRKIGVAVDLSPACEPAIETAAWLARRLKAQVHLVHVVPSIATPSSELMPLKPHVDAMRKANHADAQRRLEQLAAQMSGVEVLPVLLSGQPVYRELAHYVQCTRIDLLTMGTHGQSGFRRLFLGSTAERTIQIVPCPVLCARLPGELPVELSWEDIAEDLRLPPREESTPG